MSARRRAGGWPANLRGRRRRPAAVAGLPFAVNADAESEAETPLGRSACYATEPRSICIGVNSLLCASFCKLSRRARQ